LSSERTAAGWVPLTIYIGFRQFLDENPPSILLTALLPRPVLQYLFFIMLGGALVGPAYGDFALVGAPTVALTTVAIMVSEVPLNDKWSGAFHRLRTGRRHPFLVMLLRALPYPVFGMLALSACLLVVPPLTGHAGLGLRLLGLLPLYAVVSVTTCLAGLAVALLALGKRAEVFASNVLAYLILLYGGIILPPDRMPAADTIAAIMPVHNGLTAIRAALAGTPWLPSMMAEVAVGIGWLAAGLLIIRIQIIRSGRYGRDDYN
jgi:ABC-2 type transporter